MPRILSALRRIIVSICLLVSVAGAAAPSDIVDYFQLYYRQQIVGGADKDPLGFLGDAAKARASAEQVLKASPSRAVIEDRHNGYLQINDSSDTDQILTMAVYRKTDGSLLLAVGGSDCADACIFSVQFFVVSADRLQPVALDAVVPATAPAQFIKPGHPMPKALARLTPKINYVPARVGTTLTLTPWYGYESEEQMDKATRGAIGNVVLTWDPQQGRFVNTRRGS